jgi:hypothetical protein
LNNLFNTLKPGFSLIATKIEMRRVTADSASNGIYFEAVRGSGTSEVMVSRSSIIDDDVTVANFEWTIPLERFDRIVVKARRTNAVQALSFMDFLTLTMYSSSYEHVQVSLPDKNTSVVGKDIKVIGSGDMKIEGKTVEINKLTKINNVPIEDYFWRSLLATEEDRRLNHLRFSWKWDSRVPTQP